MTPRTGKAPTGAQLKALRLAPLRPGAVGGAHPLDRWIDVPIPTGTIAACVQREWLRPATIERDRGSTRGWTLTPAGRAVLDEQGGEP